MAISRKYFRDHIVLLLLSTEAFLALLTTVVVILRLSSTKSSGHIVQYRSNLGISAFKTGTVVDLLAFIGFAFIVLVFHTLLSLRCYHINRYLSIIVLALGIFLLVLNLIVSNALLVFR